MAYLLGERQTLAFIVVHGRSPDRQEPAAIDKGTSIVRSVEPERFSQS